MRVTILRGISGSGKSYWANQWKDKAVIVSADAYFFNEAGEYVFDMQKRPEYHRRCFRAFLRALEASTPWVIVDNTNITAWELSPYVLAGEAYGYQVEILSFPCTLELSMSRKSWLPADVLARSLSRFEQETRYLPPLFKAIHTLLPLDKNSHLF